VAIPRFIQLGMPLPLLSPMAQSQCGVTQILVARVHPLTVAIPRFIQLGMPYYLDQPATKHLVPVWYGLYCHLWIYHQCCHLLHSQQRQPTTLKFQDVSILCRFMYATWCFIDINMINSDNVCIDCGLRTYLWSLYMIFSKINKS
jgi:hypothetical protein